MSQDLESKMRATEIVGEAGMSARPEFYSGRGATSSDLNDQILEKVYQGIQKEYGKKAANQFVKMVADIPKLSATDFLLTLYRLEGRNWKWNKRMLGNEKGMDVGPDLGNGVRETIAKISIWDTLSGMSDRDETGYIRGKFLRRHGIKTKKSFDNEYGWYH